MFDWRIIKFVAARVHITFMSVIFSALWIVLFSVWCSYHTSLRVPYCPPYSIIFSVYYTPLRVLLSLKVVGDHLSSGPSFLSLDHPLNAWAKSPQRWLAKLLNPWRGLLQRGQRNEKWSTISIPRLHRHWSEFAAWILAKYDFNQHISVRS